MVLDRERYGIYVTASINYFILDIQKVRNANRTSTMKNTIQKKSSPDSCLLDVVMQ